MAACLASQAQGAAKLQKIITSLDQQTGGMHNTHSDMAAAHLEQSKPGMYWKSNVPRPAIFPPYP